MTDRAEPTEQIEERELTWLDLYDYRREMLRIYLDRDAATYEGVDDEQVLDRFRDEKNRLFARHPQSPFDREARARFAGLRYFPYARDLRIKATLEPAADDRDRDDSAAHSGQLRKAARVHFTLDGTPLSLAVYWIDVYGGGLFLPFRDATCGDETYGGGRYLFDTVKGSTFVEAGEFLRERDPLSAMGYAGGYIVLDFNYAYNPSCAYDARWVCPLAPPENRLALPVRAGEMGYH